MANKRRVSLAVLEALLFLLAVWFEPTCIVRGTLRGEAFFDGKPTSWWRRELERWHFEVVSVSTGTGEFMVPRYSREPGTLEEILERVGIRPKHDTIEFPRILHGQLARAPDAIKVLRELTADPSPEIRDHARIALRIHPEFQLWIGERGVLVERNVR